MTNTPAFEEVVISEWSDLRDGDVILGQPVGILFGNATVRRTVPAPKLGTFGTAVVSDKRIHGLIDEDGDFVFQTWSDETGANTEYTSHFDDFRPTEDQ